MYYPCFVWLQSCSSCTSNDSLSDEEMFSQHLFSSAGDINLSATNRMYSSNHTSNCQTKYNIHHHKTNKIISHTLKNHAGRPHARHPRHRSRLLGHKHRRSSPRPLQSQGSTRPKHRKHRHSRPRRRGQSRSGSDGRGGISSGNFRGR